MPTEEDLAAHYGVSVLTVRQALKPLEEEGLISRHRRRGTFIEPGAVRGAPVRLLDSVDAIVAQQSGERATVLGHGPAAVPREKGFTSPGQEQRRPRADPASTPKRCCEPRGMTGTQVSALCRDGVVT